MAGIPFTQKCHRPLSIAQENPLESNIQSLWIEIDGNNLEVPSLDNQIEVFWEEGDAAFRVSIGIGDSTTTVTEVEVLSSKTFPIPPFKLEFARGRMRVKNGTGRVQEHYWLNCPMKDVITIMVSEVSTPE